MCANRAAEPVANRIRLTGTKAILFGLVGLLAGFLSGFFGIGGGTVIVPVLVALGFSQRSAAATSLTSILPAAVAGVIAYIASGHVDYPAAALLALGIIAGAQIGSRLLVILPEVLLRWFFAIFLLAMGLAQFLLIPSRDSVILLDFASGAGLLLLGVATGILSGLLGIGGGIVVVPSLTFLFHASDLTARGTSLLMMIPGTISGTITSKRNGLTDIRVGLIIGLCACTTSPLGKLAVERITPRAAAILFGVYISLLIVRSVYVAIKYQQKTKVSQEK